MANFFVMKDDIGFPGRWHLADPTTVEGCDAADFTMGRPAQIETRPDVAIRVPGGALDFTLTDFAVPIASSRLASAIAALGDQTIQWIPTTVGGREGYEIVNATRVVRCLDEERSEFLKWKEADGRPDRAGQYRMVTKLIIDSNRVPAEAQAFRIWGWFVPLIVSRAIVEAAGRIGAVGLEFDPVG